MMTVDEALAVLEDRFPQAQYVLRSDGGPNALVCPRTPDGGWVFGGEGRGATLAEALLNAIRAAEAK